MRNVEESIGLLSQNIATLASLSSAGEEQSRDLGHEVAQFDGLLAQFNGSGDTTSTTDPYPSIDKAV